MTETTNVDLYISLGISIQNGKARASFRTHIHMELKQRLHGEEEARRGLAVMKYEFELSRKRWSHPERGKMRTDLTPGESGPGYEWDSGWLWGD